jgi:histidinol-phosphate aminotransferase
MRELSRRELLAGSALLLARGALAGDGAASSTPAGSTAAVGAGTKPIVLCWNENPYGPSPAARAAISAAIPEGCRYPDDDMEALVAALAKHENVATDHIVLGTGSGELLHAVGMQCARAQGELITAEPTYGELPDYARALGATVTPVPVDHALGHDLHAMRAAVSSRTRAVYICNPNNPTGTALSAAAITHFVESLPPTVTTVVDEAYMDFTDAPGVRSVADLVQQGKRVVVLRTFSKIHGMAGVRCGYAIATPQLVQPLADLCMTSPNIFAMRAARASLTDRAFLSDCRRRILASRARITRELSRLGYRYADPQGNFVFFDTGAPLEQFTSFMRERGILVGRRFDPYARWCRITIGTEPEVSAFLTALAAWHVMPRENST